MLKKSVKENIINFFKDRFGIPSEIIENYQFFENKENIWMVSSEIVTEEFLKLLRLKKIDFIGIKALRKTQHFKYKPTTYLVQIIGIYAKKNIIELDKEELKNLLKIGKISVKRKKIEDGYVILKFKGKVLGCGLYVNGILKHQFPKGRAKALAFSDMF